VERLVEPDGSLRRGQVDEAVAHIALIAAFYFVSVLVNERNCSAN
jgi:hypothetical protein